MVSRWWRLLPLFVLPFLLSCSDGDDGVLLRVDVITDYVPGVEFDVVEIEVEDADFRFRRPVAPDDEFLRGQRVGELQTAGEASLVLVGRLLDADGGTIAQRRVSVALRERTSQTLVFTRSCAEVSCPAGDPAATECQGGVCVSPECSPENPEACGTASGCGSAAECDAPEAECAEARCLEGICLEAEVEGSCGSGEVCQPSEGCVTMPGATDMGMPPFDGGDEGDGGTTADAFVDGGIGVDFGMPECTVDGDCDDGAYCNGEEQCLEGICQPAERAVDCDDGVACTVDSCDEAMDRCVASANDSLCTAEADGTCDADLGCQYPVCTAATCTAGPCQTASCEGDVCVRTNLCGGSEICCGGSCVPAGCDDGNPCTDDSCGGSGCVHTNNTDACSDGNACTVGDQCSGGSCGAGSARDCNDGNICTNDSCNPSSGCVNTNNTASCDDGNACTINDRCASGSCSGGGARNCNDLNPCTNDSCNPSSGCQYSNVSSGTSCGSDGCGPWSTCSGISCMFNEGNQNRTCTPRECNGSGSCVDGSSYLDSRSCTLLEGQSCAVCTECTGQPPMLCVEAYCDSSGCCREGLIE